MSFTSIQEDYLDPDKYLWPEEVDQPRCKCGAFLKMEPDRTEPWETRETMEGLDGTPEVFHNYGTELIWDCKRCGNETSVSG